MPALVTQQARANRGLVVAILASALALPSDARAQVPRSIDLGEGLEVHQVSVPCGLAQCLRWESRSLRFTGYERQLAYARTFAQVPSTGRIVAAYAVSFPGGFIDYTAVPTNNAGMLYTDDGGRRWQPVEWPWPHVANAVAFDPESEFGVAVGDSGSVWSTEDGGRSWRDRRTDGGVVYTQVAVLGRVAVFADARGRVWRSRDGGFRRTSVASAEGVQLSTANDAIVVEDRSGERIARVLASGTIVR